MCAKKVQGLLDNDITNISKPSHKVFSLHIRISSSIAPQGCWSQQKRFLNQIEKKKVSSRLPWESPNKHFAAVTQILLPPSSKFKLNSFFPQTQAVEVNNHNFWSNVFGEKLFQAFLQNVMTIISKPLHEVYSLHIHSSSSIVFSPLHTELLKWCMHHCVGEKSFHDLLEGAIKNISQPLN